MESPSITRSTYFIYLKSSSTILETPQYIVIVSSVTSHIRQTCESTPGPEESTLALDASP